MKRVLLAALAFCVAVFPTVSTTAFGATILFPGGTVSDETAATEYCAKTGGVVLLRVPEYGTNGSNPLVLANPRNFCEYTARDGSSIDVLATTLYAVKPSLAALAYYAEVKPGSCQGNPASCYCSLLGGSDSFGGVNAAGGGWVFNANVLEACVFPDASSIDSFGLFYHSANIIRGRNLAKVLRYKGPPG
jgi:putative hemolysin